MVRFQTPNDRVAGVFCPAWANTPPIGLAYLKGAVHHRPVRCFDFNHQFFRQRLADYPQVFEPTLPGVNFFAGARSIDLPGLERACDEFAQVHAGTLADWLEQLAAYGVVCFSLNMGNLVASVTLARMLKQLAGTVCLAGGPSLGMHGPQLPEFLLSQGIFDLGVFGIAEDVIEPVLDGVVEGREWSHLPGLVYAEQGRVVYSPAKRSVVPAACVPPNYDDFPLDDYYAPRRDYVSLYAVLGCLGHCEFCTIHDFHTRFSAKSVEHLKQEMFTLRARYGRNQIFFSDGMFLGNRTAAAELFDFAAANDFRLGIQIRLLPYWNDEALVEKASRCVFYLQNGMESASPTVRRAMGKMVDPSTTDAIFRLFYKYRVPLYTNIIIGYPNETDEEFAHTYRFLDEYLSQPGACSAGTNSFWVPKHFPREKYGVRTDAHGYWRSEQVTVADRVRRASTLRDLAVRHGRSADTLYAHDGVDGVPMLLEPLPDEYDQTEIRLVDEPPQSAGCVDSSAVLYDLLVLHGWARDPSTGQPPRYVLLVTEDGRRLGVSPLQADRHDVAQTLASPAMLHCGWHVSIELTQVAPATRIYCYALGDGVAYQMTNSPVAVPAAEEAGSLAAVREGTQE
jgi:hypothetical protein